MQLFADNKIDVTETLKFVLRRVENIMGKEENAVGNKKNAGYLHFRLHPQCFQTTTYTGKSRDCVIKGTVRLYHTIAKY